MRNLFYLFISAAMLIFTLSCSSNNLPYAQKKTDFKIDYNYTSSVLMKPNEEGKKFISPVVKLNFETEQDTPNRKIRSLSTGFSVHYDKRKDKSYIITNNHFCKAIDESILPGHLFYENSQTIMSQEIQFTSGEALVIAVDPAKDLCLVSIDGYIKPVEFVPDDYEIKQMDPVVIVGAPAGVFPIVRQTYISNFHVRDAFPDDMALGADLLLLSDVVFPGQSGSPVFNTQGKVIGIMCMSLSYHDENIYGGIAISYKDVKEFLVKKKIM